MVKISKERLHEIIQEEIYDHLFDWYDRIALLEAEYGQMVNIEGFGSLEEGQAKRKFAEYLTIAAKEAAKWQKGEGNVDVIKTYMANSLAFWKALKDIN